MLLLFFILWFLKKQNYHIIHSDNIFSTQTLPSTEKIPSVSDKQMTIPFGIHSAMHHTDGYATTGHYYESQKNNTNGLYDFWKKYGSRKYMNVN